jgi:hypothetical protein
VGLLAWKLRVSLQSVVIASHCSRLRLDSVVQHGSHNSPHRQMGLSLNISSTKFVDLAWLCARVSVQRLTQCGHFPLTTSSWQLALYATDLQLPEHTSGTSTPVMISGLS